MPFADLGTFDQMLAVNETAAHLDVLVQRGQLAVEDVGGVNQYTPTYRCEAASRPRTG